MKQRSMVKRKDSMSGEPLYHPSIFRYTCRGHLNLSSKTVGSPGTCQGIKSQLEHVDHWRLVTRDEAVRVFSQQTSSGGVGDGMGGGPGGGGGPGSSVPGPALTGDDATGHALETVLLSQVLIYPDNDDNDKNKKTNKKHEKIIQKVPSSSRLPEEDLITSQEWDCYGSSELDLLILRPQGETEEKIVAVAPYCSPGLSIRDVHTELGNDRTSTLRLGYVEVVVQSAAASPEEDDMENDLSNTNNKPSTETTNMNPFSKLFPKETSSSTTNQDATHPENRKKRESSSTSLSSTADTFVKMSTKVAQHMETNARMIRDAVKEDFTGRTYAAGNRIFNEFGTTLDRTVQLMGKVSQTLFGVDDFRKKDDDSKKPPNGKK